MDEYQSMNSGMRVDMSHPRYARTQYVDSAYGQAPPAGGAHGQAMHMGRYEWNGYPAQPQDQMMHSTAVRSGQANSRSTAQPLRSKIAERLRQIDREAFETRERRYQEKAEELQSELAQILRGTHPTFADAVKRLAVERDKALASAEQSHQYVVTLHERMYRQEHAQAEQAHQSEKQAIYERIAADIEERRRRLREEKDSVDISVDFMLDAGVRTSSKRNLRKRGMDLLGSAEGMSGVVAGGSSRAQSKRKANQAFSMPGLAEEDIVSDLMALRRATGVTGPLGSGGGGGGGGKRGHKGQKR
ncbi:hypothetical protein H4R20_002038 [Coemansia guatemalensis]|uniref:Sds3-like-domain-containing protein n=1 Tax=Coemansia guatemalensis TaxID=2761395 RepID=A0A9W8HWB0_9FUNG|nr:hypothetical protein H4R20_002038 [Coemansia guatemalensis]